jgi:hypothetical protein
VWAGTAAVASRVHDRVTVIVPIAALVGVLAALMVFQRLQIVAFASIQLAPTLHDIREHALPVIDAL